ncbi:hypothetical protein ACSQ6I_07955 [Anabaena sp. WFMT]|uniref:hypothetical protein n=1 Tax=Anabaena sp. WFMT TaxID=3449730 RepID=UPI003F272FA3
MTQKHYLISYDLYNADSQRYSDLNEQIQSLDSYAQKFLETTWIVTSDLYRVEIKKNLESSEVIKHADELRIIEVKNYKENKYYYCNPSYYYCDPSPKDIFFLSDIEQKKNYFVSLGDIKSHYLISYDLKKDIQHKRNYEALEEVIKSFDSNSRKLLRTTWVVSCNLATDYNRIAEVLYSSDLINESDRLLIIEVNPPDEGKYYYSHPDFN